MSGRRGLSIRAAAPADAQAISELLAGAGHPTAPGVLAEQLGAIAAGSGIALAAWEWGPPSGLIVLHWYDTLHRARRVAQIDVLVVGPAERRRGLGRLLVKAASQAARVAGCGAIDLAASTDDETTAAFCQATGFTAHGLCFTRALRKSA